MFSLFFPLFLIFSVEGTRNISKEAVNLIKEVGPTTKIWIGCIQTALYDGGFEKGVEIGYPPSWHEFCVVSYDLYSRLVALPLMDMEYVEEFSGNNFKSFNMSKVHRIVERSEFSRENFSCQYNLKILTVLFWCKQTTVLWFKLFYFGRFSIEFLTK